MSVVDPVRETEKLCLMIFLKGSSFITQNLNDTVSNNFPTFFFLLNNFNC